MRRRSWMVFLSCCALWFVLLSCGESVPSQVALCQTDQDCSPQQRCVASLCITVSTGSKEAGDKEAPSPDEAKTTSETVSPDEPRGESTPEPDAEPPNPDTELSAPDEPLSEPTPERPEEPPVSEEPADAGEPLPEVPPVEGMCRPGEQRSCYPFATGKPGQGVCKAGTQTCLADRTWGLCQNAVGPANQEVCDQQDNDCNGVVDESCPCDYDGTSKGVCRFGKRDAQGQCQPPADYKPKEICGDNKDNDCNGIVDDGCQCIPGETRSCGTNKGVCKAGTQTCNAGTWGSCQGAIPPAPNETCGDKLDNDCDGVVDEGCPCDYNGTRQGVCRFGKINTSGVCIPPSTYNKTETCNDNLDNDCDGVVDEGCPCHYRNTNKGVCTTAKRSDAGVCLAPSTYNSRDLCNDSLDNNCNGATNEYCACHYLGKNRGVCATARRDASGTCTRPATYRTSEFCGDKLDNNCNGAIDEGCRCNYLGQTKGVCTQGQRQLNGTCGAPPTYSRTEKCGDRLDNNCNGAVDEYCPCNYLGKTTGVCATAKRNARGICARPSTYLGYEVCDGLDNDCDGRTDESPTGVGTPCAIFSQRGECAKGTAQCVSGQIKCVTNQPTAEVCDLKDNDCNGLIDDLNKPCFKIQGTWCYRGEQSCVVTTQVCLVTGRSPIKRCHTTSDCTRFCPGNKTYKCVPLGGLNNDHGCKVQ